jgi:hypothetical protein
MSTEDVSTEDLVSEYTRLRNATFPKNRYGRNRYYDFLNDTDALARQKSDAELMRAIAGLKSAQ